MFTEIPDLGTPQGPQTVSAPELTLEALAGATGEAFMQVQAQIGLIGLTLQHLIEQLIEAGILTEEEEEPQGSGNTDPELDHEPGLR